MNSDVYRGNLIITFGQIVGNSLKGVEDEEVKTFLRRYNLTKLNINEMNNEEIEQKIKNILDTYHKYKGKDKRHILCGFITCQQVINKIIND